MNKLEWLGFAQRHQEPLEYLLERYHPVQNVTPADYHIKRVEDRAGITAAAAEAACENVRNDIRRNFEGSPVEQFRDALKRQDVGKINTLLNQAWFGVPESTSCWNIRGFKQAVELMEDLPDDDTESQEGATQ